MFNFTFQGKAKIRVSLTDPRNASDLFSAPGDFTTVDQSGSVQPLKTYGILRIKVQDQDNKQLDLAGNMKIYLDANKVITCEHSSIISRANVKKHKNNISCK